MEKLFHLSTTNKYIDWFDNDWEKIRAFAEKHQLDGIELGLTADYDIAKIPEGLVKGVHLSFYPMWLEFWQGRLDVVERNLGTKEDIEKYYGGLEREVMVESYRRQYERAKKLGAKYMVFHVSHVQIEDSFTWQYDYTDEEIIDATIELVNAAFPKDEEGPKLVFENLWWPGLTYTRPEILERLLKGVEYPHKGCVLDVSHLIITNPSIRNEYNCYTYIKDIIQKLGVLAKEIEVVHLNKTLPGYYLKQNHKFLLEKYQKAPNKAQKDKVLKGHIQKMDPHQPFDHEVANKILQLIQPKYCIYETNPSSIYELAHFIIRQNKALNQ
ncbi:MAG: TIM barrel protein [Cellulosilyticaceae bacterium]